MDPQTLAMEALNRGALQKMNELSALLAFLETRPLKTVVEIGTAAGGTFYSWCQISDPEATIVSIDLPGGEFGGGYGEAAIPVFSGYKQPGQTVHFLREDSHDLNTRNQLEDLLKGEKIDFLMIDGDHTYSGVKQDWELYSPLVNPGGLVAFHDTLPHPNFPTCEVDRFWQELKGGFRHFEFEDKDDDCGLGPMGWDRSH